jgi:hypothetical protein
MNNSFDMGTPSVTGGPERINPRLGVYAFLAGWIKASFVPCILNPNFKKGDQLTASSPRPDPDPTGDSARNVT